MLQGSGAVEWRGQLPAPEQAGSPHLHPARRPQATPQHLAEEVYGRSWGAGGLTGGGGEGRHQRRV